MTDGKLVAFDQTCSSNDNMRVLMLFSVVLVACASPETQCLNRRNAKMEAWNRAAAICEEVANQNVELLPEADHLANYRRCYAPAESVSASVITMCDWIDQ